MVADQSKQGYLEITTMDLTSYFKIDLHIEISFLCPDTYFSIPMEIAEQRVVVPPESQNGKKSKICRKG